MHPESYPVVQRICQLTGKTIPELIGNDAVLDGLDPKLLIDDRFGVETVKDILAELKKPGRDPRQRFEAVLFREGVNKPGDLEVGMELQGIVTNVTDFGAFVDVGVHQDGLVHLSEIAHRYVKNPADALSVGQAVKVKVLGVDLPAKRIALSIKALLAAPESAGRPPAPHRRPQARTEGQAGRPPRPEGPRPPRPEGPRPPRPEGPRGTRPGGPQAPRPEGQRPPRPEGPRPPRPQGDRPPRPEREARPAPQAGGPRPVQPPREPPTPATGSSLEELMAKFNKGHR